mmetsp:Transcript_677/g.2605  ORF Transcript_677/g.2605 Transcript_677/m.2605 type:complete len:134 (-) Transcript_677:666-1067(-)
MRRTRLSTTFATLLAMARGAENTCGRCEEMAVALRDALRDVEPETDGSVFRARRMRHPRSELDIARAIETTYQAWISVQPEAAGWLQTYGDEIDDFVYEEGPEHVPWLLCETLAAVCPSGHFAHRNTHPGDEL